MHEIIHVLRKLIDGAAHLTPNDRGELHAKLDKVAPAAPAPTESPAAPAAPADGPATA